MDDFHGRYFAQQPNQVPMSSFPSATATLSTVASAVTTSLRSVASGHGGHGDGGKPRKRHQAAVYYLSRVSWLLFAAIILVLAIHHLIVTRQQKNELKRRIALATSPPKGSRDRIPDSDIPYTDDETDDTSSMSSLGKRERRRTNDSSGLGDIESQSNRRGSRWAWWLAQQRNWLYLKTMPKWLYGPETLADSFWTLTYCVILCSFAAYSIIEATEYKLLVFANALGVLAFSQVPMIIILIQKNNPISALTGITYQKLNYLHRASSRACLLFSWIHVVIWFFPLWERTDVNYFLVGWIVWGYVAIFGFTLLWVTSFRLIRRIAFEFFMVSHIVGTFLFIVGGIFHWWRLAYWLWPALAIYAFDRALRFVKLLRINPPRSLRFSGSRSAPGQAGQCEITLLDNENMLLVAKRPGLHWTPGQHFYMSVPTAHASPHEGHPFSIANVPNERDELVFLIRVHGGLTKRLRDALKQEVTTDTPVYFDGPYGSSHSMAHYSTVILVAGGTGITFLSSHLLGLLAPSVAPTRRHIHLIWHIRHASDTVWLASLLNEAAERLKDFPLTRLTLDVHVTKSGRGNEPSQPFSLTERIAETVAPRRFSRNSPRMDHSELPSAIGSDNGDEVIEDDEDTESVMMDSLRSSRRNSSGANPTEDSRIVRGRDLENGVRERLLSMGMDRRTTDFADLHRLRHGTEQDGQEERETQYLLPPRPSVRFDMTQEGEDDDTFGLTRDAANLLVWKKGRADLVEVLENDLECTDGKVMVTVCGPVQLLHATRKAVKLVSTPERALRGQPQVEFFEETLGS